MSHLYKSNMAVEIVQKNKIESRRGMSPLLKGRGEKKEFKEEVREDGLVARRTEEN